jgi:capsular exopolysaccharide synthesis family protein
VVAQRPNSSVSESFRSVRTNFQFFDHSGKKQVVLFTSSSSGDGKTFCSINFASILAMGGHKTVLLEFDLRRPKVHSEFGASNMIGISSFLIDKAVIDDIILPTEIENLDLISAGPAAPNPAELIASERTTEFLETLKGMYDYIVIDSAPVGVVSETFLLMKYSDVNIFVVRLEYTIRDAFKNALKALQNNGFTNFSVLINDLNIRKETYKYGYDTKYYTEDNNGFFSRIFRRNKSA